MRSSRSTHTCILLGRCALAATFLLACTDMVLHAQGAWDSILTIDPYPSPYYSDWDANPNISSLTVMNTTTSAATVRIHFNVIDRTNRVVASGVSEPEPIGAGATVIIDSPYDVAGSTTHDAELEDIAARTGRLPEGDYTACAVTADQAGFVLAESCSMFTIVYPDPPLLLGPLDGEVVEQSDPLFLWTPVQVPVDYQLTYVLRVAEVLPGQTAAEALRANIPHYQSLDGQMPSVRYPIDARPLEPGRTYAWTVQALDQNGYSATANDGQSEIWSFAYDDGSEEPPKSGVTTLTLTNSAAPPAVSTSGSLADICADPTRLPTALSLDMDVDPTFLPGNAEFPVSLQYDSTTTEWALLTDSRTHSFLLYGKCDSQAPLGGLQWIARRATVGDLGLPIDTTTSPNLEWRFGVLILSLHSTKAGAMPAEFAEALRFMEHHEVSIKPGVNVYGVVNLANSGPLFDLLRTLGHNDPYITLQGFAGYASSFSVGGSIGQTFADSTRTTVGGAGSGTATILSLKAALPRRPPMLFGGVIESTQVSIALDAKAKGAVHWDYTDGAGGDRKWAGGAVELELGLSLAMLFSDGIERTGTVGFVHTALEGDTKAAADTTGKSFMEKTTAVFKLASDRAWSPVRAWPGVALADPELEISVELAGLADRIRSGSALNGVSGKITGELDVGDVKGLGKASVEVGREADKLAPTTRPRSTTIDEGSDPNGATGRPRSDANADQTTAPAGKEAEGAGKVKWKASVQLGNMSLSEFMQLVSTLMVSLVR